MNFTVADDKWQSKWEIFLFFSPFYFFVGVFRFTMTVSSRKKINSSKVIHLSGTRKSFRIWQNLKKKTYSEKSVSSLKEKEKKEKEKTNCTVCKKLFVVLLTHLNKSEKCKKGKFNNFCTYNGNHLLI